MNACKSTSKITYKRTQQDRRKNAIQNMIFFRNDQRLYIFWRNVYKRYRNAAWKEQGLFQTKGAEQ